MKPHRHGLSCTYLVVDRDSGACDDSIPVGDAPSPAVLSFNVLGVAVPFDRVSASKSGGVHEEAKYRHWKSQVADAAREAAERASWTTTVAAVRVDVTFVLIRRPTKKPRKGPDATHPIAPKSGDEDNYRKGALDAMQQARVYANDSQVLGPISAASGKRWQRPREEFAGAIVRVEIVE